MSSKHYGLIVKSRSDDYAAGHRRAMRAAIAWLHRRAELMNDQHAKQVLHSAAFSLGVDHRLARDGKLPHPAGVDAAIDAH